MKVYGYVRVSTTTQVQFGFGIDMQLDNIKKFCEFNKYELEDVFYDRGISGTVADRPGLNDLISTLETSDIKKVVVFNTSRLWRETTIQAIITKDLKKIGADIISIENPKFSIYSEGTDKLLNTIMTALDDYERYQIAKKLAKGRKTKAKKGSKACGNTPLGYKWNAAANVEIDNNTAPIVKEIFSLALKGLSLQKIADFINAKGFKTQRGNKFSKQSIGIILTNEYYTGTIIHGDIKEIGNHQPLISKITFGKVQAQLKKRKK